MLRNLFKRKVLKFVILIIVMFVLTRIPAMAAIPNLDGDSHPNRLKLSECVIDMKTVTAWDEKSTLAAADELCKLRQNHAKQKARFLADQAQIKNHIRFQNELPTSIANSWQIVKSCIDFKHGFSSPHNTGILKIPERVRSQCYALGADFIESNFSN